LRKRARLSLSDQSANDANVTSQTTPAHPPPPAGAAAVSLQQQQLAGGGGSGTAVYVFGQTVVQHSSHLAPLPGIPLSPLALGLPPLPPSSRARRASPPTSSSAHAPATAVGANAQRVPFVRQRKQGYIEV